ncbi:hypothetical protein JCM9803A_01900 [Rhodococcus erythropolis]
MPTTAAVIARGRATGVRPRSGTTCCLDRERTVRDETNLTWHDSDSKLAAEIDAKYSTIAAGRAGPNADMYKLTVDCTVLGVSEGHLIYAKGDSASHVVDFARADSTIYCHALDLTPPKQTLLELG